MSAPDSIVDEGDMIKYEDFQLSSRGKINEKEIKSKINPIMIPVIIDISIHGYSNKGNFDVKVGNSSFQQLKSICKDNVKDGSTLTIKRACRVVRLETLDYINKHNITPPLFKRFQEKAKVDKNVSNYSFIGGEFIVPINLCLDLVKLWKQFDLEKNTKISETVDRVVHARFGDQIGLV